VLIVNAGFVLILNAGQQAGGSLGTWSTVGKGGQEKPSTFERLMLRSRWYWALPGSAVANRPSSTWVCLVVGSHSSRQHLLAGEHLPSTSPGSPTWAQDQGHLVHQVADAELCSIARPQDVPQPSGHPQQPPETHGQLVAHHLPGRRDLVHAQIMPELGRVGGRPGRARFTPGSRSRSWESGRRPLASTSLTARVDTRRETAPARQ